MTHVSIPGLENIMERLENLERQNRRLKQAASAVLALASAVLVMGQAAPARETVVAQRFVVQDSQGEDRARLFIQGDRALEFYDASGRVRDEFEESSWRLLGPRGIPPVPMLAAFLGDARNPGSTLSIVGQGGARVGLSTSGDGRAFVTAIDKEGHAERMDSGHLEISGKDRKPIWQAPNNAR